MGNRRGSKEVVAVYRATNLAQLIDESMAVCAACETRSEDLLLDKPTRISVIEETLTDGSTVYNLEIRPETPEETRGENQ